MSRPILSVREVAGELGVSVDTVRGYLRRGRLAGVRLDGAGPWRVRREALERFIEDPPPPLGQLAPVGLPRARPRRGRFAAQAAEQRKGARNA